MLVLSKINSYGELLQFRTHCESFFKNELSLNLKQRKLDEKTAKFLGAKDWNTAVALVKEKEAATEQFNTSVSNIFHSTEQTLNKVRMDDEQRRSMEETLAKLVYEKEWPHDNEQSCKKCSSDLDKQGYCIDETCMYSDYKQDVETTETDSSIKFHAPPRLRVTATVWTDTRSREVEFDASDYFFDAINRGDIEKVLKDLSAIGFRGNYAADYVAQYFEEGGPGYGHNEVAAFFEHHEDINNKRALSDDPIGFECAVEAHELAEWLKQEYPDVWEKVWDLGWDQ